MGSARPANLRTRARGRLPISGVARLPQRGRTTPLRRTAPAEGLEEGSHGDNGYLSKPSGAP
jgi:hypothetical protein